MHPSRIVCILACLVFVESAIAAGPPPGFTLSDTADSPKGDISVEYYSDTQGNHQIWLAPKSKPDARVKLYEYNRVASVLIAPDEKSLLINDLPTSTGGEPLLFKRAAGLQFQQIPDAKIGDNAFNFMVQVTKLSPDLAKDVDHMSVTALRWSPNSRHVLLGLSGHGGMHVQFSSWLCVYDLQTGKPTLSLSPMNAQALEHQ